MMWNSHDDDMARCDSHNQIVPASVPARVLFGVIYLITNKLNGKKYIGQTVKSLAKRWRIHVNAAKRLYNGKLTTLGKAILKYGEEAFTIEVLESCYSREELDAREIWWIKELNSLGPVGYNQLTGGGCHAGANNPMFGRKQRPESIAKAIAKRPKVVVDEAYRKRMSEIGKKGFKGRHHTEEYKQRQSDLKRGCPGTFPKGVPVNKACQEGYRKFVEAGGYKGSNNKLFGRTLPLETRLKISATKRRKALEARQIAAPTL